MQLIYSMKKIVLILALGAFALPMTAFSADPTEYPSDWNHSSRAKIGAKVGAKTGAKAGAQAGAQAGAKAGAQAGAKAARDELRGKGRIKPL